MSDSYETSRLGQTEAQLKDIELLINQVNHSFRTARYSVLVGALQDIERMANAARHKLREEMEGKA